MSPSFVLPSTGSQHMILRATARHNHTITQSFVSDHLQLAPSSTRFLQPYRRRLCIRVPLPSLEDAGRKACPLRGACFGRKLISGQAIPFISAAACGDCLSGCTVSLDCASGKRAVKYEIAGRPTMAILPSHDNFGPPIGCASRQVFGSASVRALTFMADTNCSEILALKIGT